MQSHRTAGQFLLKRISKIHVPEGVWRKDVLRSISKTWVVAGKNRQNHCSRNIKMQSRGVQPTEEGQICFAAAERTWCPLGQAMMVAALPGKALRAEGPLQVLLTWGSPFQAGPLLWNVLKIKSDSLSRRAMQRMLHGSATEQMCCGFLSKLRAVEKPCSAACQEGITAQGLVVTGACDGVHKLSEHTSCSGWMLFHSVWSHWVFTETPCETATLGTERGWGLGSITTEQERCHICITLQFCWASTCALLRTGGTLFGIHRVSDTETPHHFLSGLDGL